MTISQLQVQEFMTLFSGSKYSYGELIYGTKEKGEKLSGKYRTIVDKLLTIEEYKAHLNGSKGLGVIPIDETDKCRFATIDIDLYSSDLTMYIEAIERGKLPLVPFKTKSGGLHLYTFFKEPVNAQKAIDLMRKYSFVLSLDSLVKTLQNRAIEIFPKQKRVSGSKDEVGSFINLPYYNSDNTTQYAIRNGKGVSLNEALLFIKEKQVSYEEAIDQYNEMAFHDAPPCLQRLYLLNPFCYFFHCTLLFTL